MIRFNLFRYRVPSTPVIMYLLVLVEVAILLFILMHIATKLGYWYVAAFEAAGS